MALQTYFAYSTKTIAVSSTAIDIDAAGFSWGATDLAEAQVAVLTAHAQPVNYTEDGTTPTATLGISIKAEENAKVLGNRNIQGLKIIRQGGTDATLSVTLYKAVP